MSIPDKNPYDIKWFGPNFYPCPPSEQRVRIVDCKNKDAWYADKIGQEFTVLRWGTFGTHVKRSDNDLKDLQNDGRNFVSVWDLEILEVK